MKGSEKNIVKEGTGVACYVTLHYYVHQHLLPSRNIMNINDHYYNTHFHYTHTPCVLFYRKCFVPLQFLSLFFSLSAPSGVVPFSCLTLCVSMICGSCTGGMCCFSCGLFMIICCLLIPIMSENGLWIYLDRFCLLDIRFVDCDDHSLQYTFNMMSSVHCQLAQC